MKDPSDLNFLKRHQQAAEHCQQNDINFWLKSSSSQLGLLSVTHKHSTCLVQATKDHHNSTQIVRAWSRFAKSFSVIRPVPSPRGALVGLAPLKQSSKFPQNWNVKHYHLWSFF